MTEPTTQTGVPAGTDGQDAPVVPSATPDANQPAGTGETTSAPGGQEASSPQPQGIDITNPEVIAALPPEVQATIKGLQADYTRKTQEIAEQKQYGDTMKSLLEQSGMTLAEFNQMKERMDAEPDYDQSSAATQPATPQPGEQPSTTGEPPKPGDPRMDAMWNQHVAQQVELAIKEVGNAGYDWTAMEPRVKQYYAGQKRQGIVSPLKPVEVCDLLSTQDARKAALLEKQKQDAIAATQGKPVPPESGGTAGGGGSAPLGNEVMSMDDAVAAAEKELNLTN